METWKKSPPPATIAPGEVHVWRFGLDLPDGLLARLRPTLSPDELARAGRFRFPLHAGRFVAGRARLRALLSRYTGVAAAEMRFRYTARGKPELDPNPGALHFNLAHSDGLALCAVARNLPLGVDLERLDRAVECQQIAERFFSPAEAAAIAALPAASRRAAFFRCWTRKEALLKATGEGLSFGLNQFTVTVRDDEPARVLHWPVGESDSVAWNLTELEPAPGYTGALALRGRLEAVCCREYDPAS